jgi:hypothetical protein
MSQGERNIDVLLEEEDGARIVSAAEAEAGAEILSQPWSGAKASYNLSPRSHIAITKRACRPRE